MPNGRKLGEELTDDHWSLLEQNADAIWAMISRNTPTPRKATKDDQIRMVAAAALGLGWIDVAEACAALGNFNLALRK